MMAGFVERLDEGIVELRIFAAEPDVSTPLNVAGAGTSRS
jgi:hypothetical protein